MPIVTGHDLSAANLEDRDAATAIAVAVELGFGHVGIDATAEAEKAAAGWMVRIAFRWGDEAGSVSRVGIPAAWFVNGGADPGLPLAATAVHYAVQGLGRELGRLEADKHPLAANVEALVLKLAGSELMRPALAAMKASGGAKPS